VRKWLFLGPGVWVQALGFSFVILSNAKDRALSLLLAEYTDPSLRSG